MYQLAAFFAGRRHRIKVPVDAYVAGLLVNTLFSMSQMPTGMQRRLIAYLFWKRRTRRRGREIKVRRIGIKNPFKSREQLEEFKSLGHELMEGNFSSLLP